MGVSVELPRPFVAVVPDTTGEVVENDTILGATFRLDEHALMDTVEAGSQGRGFEQLVVVPHHVDVDAVEAVHDVNSISNFHSPPEHIAYVVGGIVLIHYRVVASDNLLSHVVEVLARSVTEAVAELDDVAMTKMLVAGKMSQIGVSSISVVGEVSSS